MSIQGKVDFIGFRFYENAFENIFQSQNTVRISEKLTQINYSKAVLVLHDGGRQVLILFINNY